MMKCPICGKGMLRGMVISSGSMPFSTKEADAYICMDCGQVFAIYKVK